MDPFEVGVGVTKSLLRLQEQIRRYNPSAALSRSLITVHKMLTRF